ncbi:MAG: hypothetical protein JXB88_21330 [Spirochaetales bacterium]|nr:hypothetical protein [Spirochaetales bacterium]
MNDAKINKFIDGRKYIKLVKLYHYLQKKRNIFPGEYNIKTRLAINKFITELCENDNIAMLMKMADLKNNDEFKSKLITAIGRINNDKKYAYLSRAIRQLDKQKYVIKVLREIDTDEANLILKENNIAVSSKKRKLKAETDPFELELKRMITILGKGTGKESDSELENEKDQEVIETIERIKSMDESLLESLNKIMKKSYASDLAVRRMINILNTIATPVAVKLLSSWLQHYEPSIKIKILTILEKYDVELVKKAAISGKLKNAVKNEMGVLVRKYFLQLLDKLKIDISWRADTWEEIAKLFNQYEIPRTRPDFTKLNSLLYSYPDEIKHAVWARIGFDFMVVNEKTAMQCFVQGLRYYPHSDSTCWSQINVTLFNHPEAEEIQQKVKSLPCPRESEPPGIQRLVTKLQEITGLPGERPRKKLP